MTVASGLRVLIVEDDERVARSTARFVRRCGAEAYCAPTIADAERELEARDFDAVVLDIHLPDGLGSDLLERMRAEARRMPVLVQTALRSPSLLNVAHRNGAYLVLKGGSNMGRHIDVLLDGASWHRWVGAEALGDAARATASELRLTPREKDVLALAVRGHTLEQMAETLGIGLSSVRTHARSLRRKAGKRRLRAVVRLVHDKLGHMGPDPM